MSSAGEAEIAPCDEPFEYNNTHDNPGNCVESSDIAGEVRTVLRRSTTLTHSSITTTSGSESEESSQIEHSKLAIMECANDLISMSSTVDVTPSSPSSSSFGLGTSPLIDYSRSPRASRPSRVRYSDHRLIYLPRKITSSQPLLGTSATYRGADLDGGDRILASYNNGSLMSASCMTSATTDNESSSPNTNGSFISYNGSLATNPNGGQWSNDKWPTERDREVRDVLQHYDFGDSESEDTSPLHAQSTTSYYGCDRNGTDGRREVEDDLSLDASSATSSVALLAFNPSYAPTFSPFSSPHLPRIDISKQNQHTKSCISAPHNSTVQQLHNLNEKQSLNGSSLSGGHGFSILAEDKFLTRHAFSQNSPYHPTRLDEYTMSNRITNGTLASGICRRDLNAFSKSSYSDYIEMQNVAVMEWLYETSLLKISHILHTTFVGKEAFFGGKYKIARFFNNLANIKKNKVVDVTSGCDLNTATPRLFGMPLSAIAARTTDGVPLPQCVRQIMKFILEHSADNEGIFRKNGVKLRIQEIKEQCSKLDVNESLPEECFTEFQLHNFADVFKQYFRDLPECLMTNRISSMLENAMLDISESKRLKVIHYCVVLLPTENRETLSVVLKFLHNIASDSATNHMTAENLATCLMPSLFCLQHTSIGPLNRLARRRTIGMPSERERNAYNALKETLTAMIQHHELLLAIPKESMDELKYLSPQKLPHQHAHADLIMPLRNGAFDFGDAYLRKFRQQYARLRTDYLNGWKGWNLQRVYHNGIRLFYWKSENETLLMEYLVEAVVETSANRLHAAILRKRYLWERNVLKCERIGSSGSDFDVIKVTYEGINAQRHAYLARRWTYPDMNSTSLTKKCCSLIERSVAPPKSTRFPEQRVNVYKSEFLIVPNESDRNRCQLVYISKSDIRGKTSAWYKKVYGESIVEQIRHLSNYFIDNNNNNSSRRTLPPKSSSIETVV